MIRTGWHVRISSTPGSSGWTCLVAVKAPAGGVFYRVRVCVHVAWGRQGDDGVCWLSQAHQDYTSELASFFVWETCCKCVRTIMQRCSLRCLGPGVDMYSTALLDVWKLAWTWALLARMHYEESLGQGASCKFLCSRVFFGRQVQTCISICVEPSATQHSNMLQNAVLVR